MFRLSNALSTMKIVLKFIETHHFDFVSRNLIFHYNSSVYSYVRLNCIEKQDFVIQNQNDVSQSILIQSTRLIVR